MVDNIHKLVIHLDPAKDPTPIIKENPSDKSRRLDVVISHIKAYRLSDSNRENFLENGFVNMEKVLREKVYPAFSYVSWQSDELYDFDDAVIYSEHIDFGAFRSLILNVDSTKDFLISLLYVHPICVTTFSKRDRWSLINFFNLRISNLCLFNPLGFGLLRTYTCLRRYIEDEKPKRAVRMFHNLDTFCDFGDEPEKKVDPLLLLKLKNASFAESTRQVKVFFIQEFFADPENREFVKTEIKNSNTISSELKSRWMKDSYNQLSYNSDFIDWFFIYGKPNSKYGGSLVHILSHVIPTLFENLSSGLVYNHKPLTSSDIRDLRPCTYPTKVQQCINIPEGTLNEFDSFPDLDRGFNYTSEYDKRTPEDDARDV